jgi:hypothetical protein
MNDFERYEAGREAGRQGFHVHVNDQQFSAGQFAGHQAAQAELSRKSNEQFIKAMGAGHGYKVKTPSATQPPRELTPEERRKIWRAAGCALIASLFCILFFLSRNGSTDVGMLVLGGIVFWIVGTFAFYVMQFRKFWIFVGTLTGIIVGLVVIAHFVQ